MQSKIWMAALLAVTFATGSARAEKNDDDHPKPNKTSKGALKEKNDPKKDLKLQKENVAKLHEDAVEDRKAGNRVGAWAAESDAKHAQKLVDKDKQMIKAGETTKTPAKGK